MTLDRLAYFRQPTVKEVRDGRRHVYIDTAKDLVDIVEGLATSDVAVLTERIIPVECYSAQNFLKRGNAVRLEYPRSLEAVREGVIHGKVHGPRRTRDDAFKQMTNGFHAGYEWFTPNFQARRRVFMDTSIHGFRLYGYCFWSHQREDKIIVHGRNDRARKGYHSHAESPAVGWTYDVEVPSCSREGRHPLQLTGVPAVARDPDPERVNVVRRLNVADHGLAKTTDGLPRGCQLQHYLELTFKQPESTIFCHHAIAAYFEVSRQIRCETGRFPLQPFAIPKPKTLEIDRRLREQTLRAFVDSSGHVRYRRLNLAEREIFWSHYILKHRAELDDDSKNPFYAVDGLPTYKKALNLQA